MKFSETAPLYFILAILVLVGWLASQPIHYPKPPIGTTMGQMYAPGTYPDYPGAVNKTLTDASKTICNKNWSTSSIRPPTSYTNPLKAQKLTEFNKKYGTTYKLADGELDHIISIELLGDPKDPNNLAFEPYNIPYGAHQKDLIENELHKDVCTGQISLQVAQKAIVNSWVVLYDQMAHTPIYGSVNILDNDDI